MEKINKWLSDRRDRKLREQLVLFYKIHPQVEICYETEELIVELTSFVNRAASRKERKLREKIVLNNHMTVLCGTKAVEEACRFILTGTIRTRKGSNQY